MKNKLTPALERRLRKLAQKDFPKDVGEGRGIVFRVCRVCGNAQYGNSTAAEGRFRVEVEDLAPPDCIACTTVMQRAPEIYRWVTGVVVHQQDQSTVAGDSPIGTTPP